MQRACASVTAEGPLELEQRAEEGPCRQAGRELDGTVQEAGLVDVADRIGIPEASRPG